MVHDQGDRIIGAHWNKTALPILGECMSCFMYLVIVIGYSHNNCSAVSVYICRFACIAYLLCIMCESNQEEISKAVAGRRCSLVLTPTQDEQMKRLITKLLK